MAVSVLINFKDLENDERVRRAIETRTEALSEEFPETTRFEITLSQDGSDYAAHGHVTGSHTEVAGHAHASEMIPAADKLMETLERQLRKIHDKKIFSKRRAVQKDRERQRSG